MSTRCTITVCDDTGEYSLYRHSDGYPETVLPDLREAIRYAWPLPRFEADDFAAAIVAAWKCHGGSIRLSAGRDAHGDTAYHYVIRGKDRQVLATYYTRTRNDTWRKVGRAIEITAPDDLASWHNPRLPDYMKGSDCAESYAQSVDAASAARARWTCSDLGLAIRESGARIRKESE